MKEIYIEYLHSLSLLDDKERVRINGVLIVGSAGDFLQSRDEKNKIRITDESLSERLLHHVPCYLGGRNIYCDTASLIVNIRKINAVIEISSVESGTVTRDDEGSYNFS